MLNLKVTRLEEAPSDSQTQGNFGSGILQDIRARRIPPGVRRLIAPARYSNSGGLADEKSRSYGTGGGSALCFYQLTFLGDVAPY